ncbi:asparaginyl-tRNA synthetase [Myotisia sp. PD_48]|nr:asparaginyl-tRNA synthetase [Myotisia sp. PD_48]
MSAIPGWQINWRAPMRRQAQYICRRCLSASASTIKSQSESPLRLRCAQILNQSKISGEGSGQLDHQKVQIRGHIRFLRKQKRFAFAHISDGSSLEPIQAILTAEQATELSQGVAVEISGIWQPSPHGKQQTHELQTTDVRVVGESDPATYPIQKKFHSPEFLRQLPHLRLRTPYNSLLSRLRSECLFQVSSVFRSRVQDNFVQVQPPIITSSDCEGAGEVFKINPREANIEDGQAVEFFRTPKYLTVSSQLHLEAYAAELGNVWTLSPTFRAEKSDTPRHLSEFYMLEVEMSYLDSLYSLTNFVESFLRDLTQRMYESPAAQELFNLKQADDHTLSYIHPDIRQRWLALIEGPEWPRITYSQAITFLHNSINSGKSKFDFQPSWNTGLQLEHEKFLVDTVGKGLPVFIMDYPKVIKPFYMAPTRAEESDTLDSEPMGNQPASASGDTVACFDLLLPEVCEVVGGSLREHRLAPLIQNMRDHGLLKQRDSSIMGNDPGYPHLRADETLGPLQWYADLRQWGSVPHGGFGIGFDRYLGYLTGVSSLRDLVPFPRYSGRADC